MDNSDLKQYLDFAKALALEAGTLMKRYFRADDIATEWKEDNTPLTIADTTINGLVIERVKKAYPEHGVLGEEDSFESKRDMLWVVDPIDGTMPFSAGLPISTFSLALVKNGVPQVGVVYDPFCDRLFTAITGKGAYLNGKKIAVKTVDSLTNSYVNMETWGTENFLGDAKLLAIDGLREKLIEAGAKPFTLCSMVISGVLVASGDFSGSVFGVTKPEDIAALKVIVEEAGGKVTDVDGNEQRYDRPIKGAIVSNGAVHDQLIKIVQDAHTRH